MLGRLKTTRPSVKARSNRARPSGQDSSEPLSAESTRADLVKQMRGSQDPGFAELYGREAEQVFRTVLQLCSDPALAQDATQEAFARALERWDRLRNAPWAGGWVMTTALNVARRSLRKQRPHPTVSSSNPDTDVIELWQVVASLPPSQRAVVVLRYRVGLETSAIAQAMGLAEGTVRTHLARATKTLRQQLNMREVEDGSRPGSS